MYRSCSQPVIAASKAHGSDIAQESVTCWRCRGKARREVPASSDAPGHDGFVRESGETRPKIQFLVVHFFPCFARKFCACFSLGSVLNQKLLSRLALDPNGLTAHTAPRSTRCGIAILGWLGPRFLSAFSLCGKYLLRRQRVLVKRTKVDTHSLLLVAGFVIGNEGTRLTGVAKPGGW